MLLRILFLISPCDLPLNGEIEINFLSSDLFSRGGRWFQNDLSISNEKNRKIGIPPHNENQWHTIMFYFTASSE